jgi:hypothetical protein
MGTTDNGTDGAAARLQHLQQYFREHPVTGPVEGRSTLVHPGAPLNLGTLDHVRDSVREVAEHTYAINPKAGPVPAHAAAVYDWAREHTEHADDIDRQRLAVIEYRQYLEHAIRAGDWRKVIRPQRCPKCNTFSLMWSEEMGDRVLCTNDKCLDRDGFSTMPTLSRLAHAHVNKQKNLRRVSAT